MMPQVFYLTTRNVKKSMLMMGNVKDLGNTWQNFLAILPTNVQKLMMTYVDFTKVSEMRSYLPHIVMKLKMIVTSLPASSECMGKTFQAATTNTWELFGYRSLMKNIFLISAKLNFHQPLVCTTVRDIKYYTPEVGGSSVWQISKIYFAGGIYGQKALMISCGSLNRFPHTFTRLTYKPMEQFQNRDAWLQHITPKGGRGQLVDQISKSMKYQRILLQDRMVNQELLQKMLGQA